jgi:hypothetical protein
VTMGSEFSSDSNVDAVDSTEILNRSVPNDPIEKSSEPTTSKCDRMAVPSNTKPSHDTALITSGVDSASQLWSSFQDVSSDEIILFLLSRRVGPVVTAQYAYANRVHCRPGWLNWLNENYFKFDSKPTPAALSE